jgi:hypothetical protein
MKLPRLAVAAAIALGAVAQTSEAYSIKTYRGTGASRIQACSSAKQSALSPGEETAHGRLTKVGACQCDRKDPAGHPVQWECWVQTVHQK